jgi:DNA polymerase V
MSSRVMATLSRFVEEVEMYSIDEAFLDLTGYDGVYPNLTELANTLRLTVLQWTRIPVSVGIAPTKTLCKVANFYAKRQSEHNGVLLLDTDAKRVDALADFDVSESHLYRSQLRQARS